MEHEVPTHEFRVWCENGDLVALVEVYHRHTWYTIESQPFHAWQAPVRKGLRSEYHAVGLAKVMADRYLEEAIADATEQLGEPPVGVMSDHGYSIQIVENEV